MKSVRVLGGASVLLLLNACSPAADEHSNLAEPSPTTNTLQSVAPSSLDIANRQSAIRSYFGIQTAALHAVATTHTSDGITYDWVVPGPLASPPPPMVLCKENCAKTSLQNEPSAGGPAGTVPVVRFNVDAYLGSVAVPPSDPAGVLGSLRKGGEPGAPSPDAQGYYYASWKQKGTFYGGGVALNTWSPVPGVTSATGGHSLSELSVYGGTDSIEVGQTQDLRLNGTSTPCLFTYFTTDTYQQTGDYIGGYNQTVKGWNQVSSDIAPGTPLGTSSTGGTQYEIEIETMQYQGNYWVWVNTEWIGYYPTSLFAASGIANSAIRMQAYGEVDDLKAPKAVAIGMGSGAFASAGWAGAAYIRDFHRFTNTVGNYAGFSPSDGSTFVTDSNCYTMSALQGDGSSENCSTTSCLYSAWFNYFYYGGPGLGGACQ